VTLELRNPVKAKLLAGGHSIGSWCVSGNPLSAEILATQGFEWVTVDIEHHPIDVAVATECFRAIQMAGAVPFARLPAYDPTWIKRFLDAGALGVIIPLIRSAEDVRNVVEWSRFPPLGRRPFGGGRGYFLYGREQYIRSANEVILVLVQIETPEAVNCLDEILAIEGIDGCFVGPTDLSLALGLPLPGAPSAERDELVASLARRIRAAGKICATVGRSPEQAADLIGQGYQFVSVGGDLHFVQRVAADAVDDLRRRGLMPDVG
jgi:2-keto-3-deoxy-L-rhamnonate aldolase RhmA